MPKSPRLDLTRLERDTAKASANSVALAPGGKPATGLMALVRDNLDALVALQAGGRTWQAIADGLTAQGFRMADGRDLTDKALTGIISSVRRQARRLAARETLRQARDDLVSRPTAPTVGRRLGLAADLVVASPVRQAASADTDLETAIRREGLAKLQDLLKKD